MSKSEYNDSCSTRTINLAKQGTSLEARKLKLLVYEKDQEKCVLQKCEHTATLPVGITQSPKSAKRIRVCTAQDLKKACPPVMCDCKPKVPVSAFRLFRNAFCFGVKCAVAGGLVLLTCKMGIWGDAEQSEKVVHESMAFWKESIFYVAPAVAPKNSEEDSDGTVKAMVPVQHIQGQSGWNRAVQKACAVISEQASHFIGLFVSPPEPCEPVNKDK